MRRPRTSFFGCFFQVFVYERSDSISLLTAAKGTPHTHTHTNVGRRVNIVYLFVHLVTQK
jgi:hypothetical protein